MTLVHNGTPTDQHSEAYPYVEQWTDSEGNAAKLARVSIGEYEGMAFSRQDNQSGIRRAIGYLSEATGIDVPRYERSEGSPVILISSPESVTIYDTRLSERRVHVLAKTDDGSLRHEETIRFTKDMGVSFRADDTVFFGVISSRAERAQPSAEHPSFEFLRHALAASRAGQRQKTGLGRLLLRRPKN